MRRPGSKTILLQLGHSLLFLLLFLAACFPSRRGSNDDDDSAADDDDSTADDDDDEEVPQTAHCDSVSGWSADWSEFEERVLELTNAVRAEGTVCGADYHPPVAALVMQEHLRCSARLHSVDMVDRNFFEHTNPDGLGPAERISEAGYEWFGFGENIGWGPASAEEMMLGWIDSPEHCSNLMTDWFTELGVGYYAAGGQRLWTQNFGMR